MAEQERPARFLSAVEIPDMAQSDPKGKFPLDGKMYCAPVAVSNALMAMFREELEQEEMTQYDLVDQLASIGYMNTNLKTGTNLDRLLRGLDRYVGERKGVKTHGVWFQGVRKHDREFSAGLRKPSLKWIQSHLAAHNSVWMLVGWYQYKAETKEYLRIGGHWVTVVGYGEDRRGRAAPNMLIVHDPAMGSGMRARREYVSLTTQEEGLISEIFSDYKFPAKGMYRLGGDLRLLPRAKFAFLDGAVSLQVELGKEPAKQPDPFAP